MKIRSSRLLVGLLAAALSCAAFAADKAAPKASAPVAKNGVLATVNGQPIPKAVYDVFLEDQVARGAPNNAEVQKAIREELVRREVMAQEARKLGLDKKPGFQIRVDMLRQTALVGSYIDSYVKAHPVTDADIKKEYQQLVAKNAKREYKVRHILVEKEDHAKAIIAKLKGGAKFADLAKESKDTGSAANGGDLGWNSTDAYVKPFSEAMVKLEKGKYTTTPVKSEYGYHVIELDDVRDATPPPFDQVKPQLKQRMQQQVIEKHIAELMKKSKVQ